jgi:transglutaminase-like putative cysteine protease
VLGIKRNQGVEDVLQQRSGDHYDLNRLFVSMARAGGVPAWMILLPDREYKIFVPSCSV